MVAGGTTKVCFFLGWFDSLYSDILIPCASVKIIRYDKLSGNLGDRCRSEALT